VNGLLKGLLTTTTTLSRPLLGAQFSREWRQYLRAAKEKADSRGGWRGELVAVFGGSIQGEESSKHTQFTAAAAVFRLLFGLFSCSFKEENINSKLLIGGGELARNEGARMATSKRAIRARSPIHF
jgi:hypothetical protein